MKCLITGGAGFIGINSAEYYLNKNFKVTILDNFSRRGADKNVTWLKKSKYAQNLEVIKADLRADKDKLQKAVKDSDLILHLAGQVAVTTSVKNPQQDFENNLLGTFNLIETVRKAGRNPVLIYSSTNKVYGGLEHRKTKESAGRYIFKDLPQGVDENENLDFHSPYGCSKGAADQYIRDYSRIYGLNTIVFRQSCIYGEHQFGIEDQGWVAWFIIALTLDKKISIYGTGKQVRDILYIQDLLHAYDLAFKNIKKTKGQIYNIGGGPKNTLSVYYEFVPILEQLMKKKIKVAFANERPGDQPIYISNINKAKKDFNWRPKTGVKEGIRKIYDWIQTNKKLFK